MLIEISLFASRAPLFFAQGLISSDAGLKLIVDFLKSLLAKSLRSNSDSCCILTVKFFQKLAFFVHLVQLFLCNQRSLCTLSAILYDLCENNPHICHRNRKFPVK